MQSKKQKSKTKSRTSCYNKLPTKVSRKDFNQFIDPYLSRRKYGPKPKVSRFKIFNYILYVLHTGVQWNELKTLRGEISWQNVYHYHNLWNKDDSYKRLFESSVKFLDDRNELDLSILHGDGSNVVAKKGEKKLDTRDTNIRKVRKF